MKYIKVIYWISTSLVLLTVGLGSLADIFKLEVIQESTNHIQFPMYILPFFGLAKLSGSIAILFGSKQILREWAYAGITFYFVGATYVHIAVGDGLDKIIVPVLILFITLVSYWSSKR